MADHPIRTAAATESGVVENTLLEQIVKRNALVLGPTESLGDIDQDTGEKALAVIHAATGYLYFYDDSDTTTLDDGLTTLVDGSGNRYHLQDSAAISLNAVEAQLNTPPGSPSTGQAWIVGTSPTGAWASNANDIAVYTARGWIFATPQIGLTVLNKGTDTNWQFRDDSTWGGFDAEQSAGSVLNQALQFPMGMAIESVENTPPGSPTEGLYYIVGDSPTGDFSGESNNVATYRSSAWVFMDAYEGARVFNRDTDAFLIYQSGEWLGSAGSQVQTFSTPGSFSWTKPSLGTMAIIEVWGAGASGAAGNQSGGGGGGAYNMVMIPLADLASSVSVTVGQGGASVSPNSNGNVGGNSSFGTHCLAYGGGRGAGGGTGGGGGGGGGVNAVGGNASSSTGAAGGDGPGSGAGGAGGDLQNDGVDGDWGGGGGGGGSGATVGDGGNSLKGGAGGGGGGDDDGGSGGTSNHGGDGGDGATGGTNGGDGQQPGGGGGASDNGDSGAGGDGRVRVTVV